MRKSPISANQGRQPPSAKPLIKDNRFRPNLGSGPLHTKIAIFAKSGPSKLSVQSRSMRKSPISANQGRQPPSAKPSFSLSAAPAPLREGWPARFAIFARCFCFIIWTSLRVFFYVNGSRRTEASELLKLLESAKKKNPGPTGVFPFQKP